MLLSRSRISQRLQFLLLVCVICILLLFYQGSISSVVVRAHSRQILQTRLDDDSVDNSTLEMRLLNHPNHPVKEMYNTGNVPDVYFQDPRIKKPTGLNKTCARFPGLFDLAFRNTYWQIQKTSRGTLHLFNAYFDDRNGSMVRILGMYDQYRVNRTFFCHLWYDKLDKPIIVESLRPFWMWRPKWGADSGTNLIHPYLITCPLPHRVKKIPSSVSLVEDTCQRATNNLKVFHEGVGEKRDFVVCVKGLDFPNEDKSVRMAEWIELLGILGADKINFYEFKVDPNTKKLLDYYVEQGRVEVTPLTLVGDYSNHPLLQHMFLKRKIIERRLQEVIPYNDCLYKHLYQFKYVVLLDIDEVIVPFQGTWRELVKTLQNQHPGGASSYFARNVYFLDSHLHDHGWFEGIPLYMHMLQHVYRAQNYTKPGYFVKAFHDTSRVVALHNHHPFDCFGGCVKYEINITLAHLQHYRGDCVRGVRDCDEMKVNSVLDTRIWNYKDELIEKVMKTIRSLDFFN